VCGLDGEPSWIVSVLFGKFGAFVFSMNDAALEECSFLLLQEKKNVFCVTFLLESALLAYVSWERPEGVGFWVGKWWVCARRSLVR
jgi:hypothetical protein